MSCAPSTAHCSQSPRDFKLHLGKKDKLVVVAAIAVTIAEEESRLDQAIEIIVALLLVSHSSSEPLLVIRCLLASKNLNALYLPMRRLASQPASNPTHFCQGGALHSSPCRGSSSERPLLLAQISFLFVLLAACQGKVVAIIVAVVEPPPLPLSCREQLRERKSRGRREDMKEG